MGALRNVVAVLDMHIYGRHVCVEGRVDDWKNEENFSPSLPPSLLSLSLRQNIVPPLIRMRGEFHVFRDSAIRDLDLSIQRLEKARMEYRATLLWMKDVSEKLHNPDYSNQLIRFREVHMLFCGWGGKECCVDAHLAATFAWFGREGVLCGCYLAATFAWFGREGVLCGCSLN